MHQQHSFYRRRIRRRQNGYYQAFPSYHHFEQQPSDFQNGQNIDGGLFFQHHKQSPYQQHYQYPYQDSYYPYFGNGGSDYFTVKNSNTPYPTPYPTPTPYFKQPPSGLQTIISQFKKSDGQIDINKMMDTAGQMMSAVNQMGGLFKGVTSIFK